MAFSPLVLSIGLLAERHRVLFFGPAVRFNRTTGGYGAARHLSDLSASRSMDCDLWVLSRWVFCVVFWPINFWRCPLKFWVERQQVLFWTIPCGRQTVQRAATARSGTECFSRAARKTREPCKKGAGEPKNRWFCSASDVGPGVSCVERWACVGLHCDVSAGAAGAFGASRGTKPGISFPEKAGGGVPGSDGRPRTSI